MSQRQENLHELVQKLSKLPPDVAEQVAWLGNRVADNAAQGYFGTLDLTFQNGRLQYLRWGQTEKPPELNTE